MANNIDQVTEYAREVVKGNVLASQKNIQACKRHLKDLNTDNFKYKFDVEESEKVIKFLEMLPDPKSGKPMKLAGFQKFIAGSLMGWKDHLGNRRFTKGYISMSRKNGKLFCLAS